MLARKLDTADMGHTKLYYVVNKDNNEKFTFE